MSRPNDRRKPEPLRSSCSGRDRSRGRSAKSKDQSRSRSKPHTWEKQSIVSRENGQKRWKIKPVDVTEEYFEQIANLSKASLPRRAAELATAEVHLDALVRRRGLLQVKIQCGAQICRRSCWRFDA